MNRIVLAIYHLSLCDQLFAGFSSFPTWSEPCVLLFALFVTLFPSLICCYSQEKNRLHNFNNDGSSSASSAVSVAGVDHHDHPFHVILTVCCLFTCWGYLGLLEKHRKLDFCNGFIILILFRLIGPIPTGCLTASCCNDVESTVQNCHHIVCHLLHVGKVLV